MRLGWWIERERSILAGCLVLTLQPAPAQQTSAPNTAAATRSVLVQKAHALESRGRPDMAAQLWQQTLLSDPNNAEALAGLAKDYKLMGAAERANQTLDRLRAVNPNDQNIAEIEALPSTQAETDKLRRAGDLARQGKAEDAVSIYRQLYGDHPPDNDIGLAYYQTLHATPNGKTEAVAGLRGLVQRNPRKDHFALALGEMLTYDPETRTEGIRILEAHPKDPDAERALRRALIWNAPNPATAGALRRYLKAHPQDAEVASNLRADELKLAKMNTGIARTAAERAAFAALNAHQLDEAQSRFADLLKEEPNNGRAAAGMGFLRMQQKNFAGAISYLSQAELDGFRTKAVEDALTESRFWDAMARATQALDEDRPDVAEAQYKAALGINSRRAEALNGLAGALMKDKHYPDAAGIYQQLIAIQPESEDGWRGLFLSYALDHRNEKALDVMSRFPRPVKTALDRDPNYLSALAGMYEEQGRDADGERVLERALALRFTSDQSTLRTDIRVQYAGLLIESKRYGDAATEYTEILSENEGNVPAWIGLVSAQHEAGQDGQAIATLQKMPATTKDAALTDPGFDAVAAAIEQQAGQYDEARNLLERAVRLDSADGKQPSVALQLQLAGIDLARKNTAEAIATYRRLLAADPNQRDAWKGLIGALLADDRNSDALTEMGRIPAAARNQLGNDIQFEQSEASVYAATGDLPHALAAMNRVQAHYVRLGAQPPADVDLQNAWLQYNQEQDRALYAALVRLGNRTDLTDAQKSAVQTIWAEWSVRRAADAMDNGDVDIAEDILDAALRAFPDNLSVRKSVAGGYARIGRAKDALKLYKEISFAEASPGDFQGAIGAALTANDRQQAEVWLKLALDHYAHDPAILATAARYEQSRGNNQRAAEYWRAALAAMPPESPSDKLERELGVPEHDRKTHRAPGGAGLRELLDPDYNPGKRTSPDANPENGPAPTPQLFHQQSAVRGWASDGGIRGDAVYHPLRYSATRRDFGREAMQYSGVTGMPNAVVRLAQYTPSAQEAETGASSVARQSESAPKTGKKTREANQVSPREEAEMQLRAIESEYSGWLGGTGLFNYRSGALGYDHLSALEAPFEASPAAGYSARFTAVAKPVFLDSGQADGSATITVLRSGSTGTSRVSIPEPIGTLTATSTTPPIQQNASGVGGEVQLAFSQFAIAAGYTPRGFLVSTVSGRMMWRPANGPITVSFTRDSERDTQLSYAGLRDPGATSPGQIWGGVVYNQGSVRFARGDAQSGFYLNVGGQYLTGSHVEINRRVDGNGGAWWRVKTAPEYGTLSVGVNFFAMHYGNNQNAFTHGMGGYFSPQQYLLANVPFSFTGHYGTRWHYDVVGAIGVQAFQEDKTALWPLAVDKALEASQGNPMLPDTSNVSADYDLHGQMAYQLSPRWFAGGFFAANNTRNYTAASVGFAVHYMFRSQPAAVERPTGLFPSDGLRPFTVP